MFIRAVLLFFFLLTIIIANAFANPIPKRKVDPNFKPKYGVSYSFEQAGWYGLDGRKSYIETLDQFKFDWVRLPFFWNQMIDDKGNLKIDDLEFAITEAQQRSIGVIVAIGAKTPYYPEFHWPDNVASKAKFGDRLTDSHSAAADILAIDQKVVERLAKFDNIIYWQVENEPLLSNVNGIKIDPSLIQREVEVVRKTDPKKRPVILNHPAGWAFDRQWKQLLSILEKDDVFATNAYFKTQGTELFAIKIFGSEIHLPWPEFLVWPVQSWPLFSPNYQSIKEEVEKHGNHLWVLEMQSEPYIRVLPDASKNIFFYSPADIKSADDYLESYEIESIGFWGVHFWQYREKLNDKSWIDTVSTVSN